VTEKLICLTISPELLQKSFEINHLCWNVKEKMCSFTQTHTYWCLFFNKEIHRVNPKWNNSWKSKTTIKINISCTALVLCHNKTPHSMFWIINDPRNVEQHFEECFSKAKHSYPNLISADTNCLDTDMKEKRNPCSPWPQTHIYLTGDRGAGQRGEREGRAALPAWGVWHVPSPGLPRTRGQSK